MLLDCQNGTFVSLFRLLFCSIHCAFCCTYNGFAETVDKQRQDLMGTAGACFSGLHKPYSQENSTLEK